MANSRYIGTNLFWVKPKYGVYLGLALPNEWIPARLCIFEDNTENYWSFLGDNKCYPMSQIILESIGNCEAPDVVASTISSPAQVHAVSTFSQQEIEALCCRPSSQVTLKHCKKCDRDSVNCKQKYCGDGRDKDNEHQWEVMTDAAKQEKQREGRIITIKTAARAQAFEDASKLLEDKAVEKFREQVDHAAQIWRDTSVFLKQTAIETREQQSRLEQEFGRYDG